MSESTQQPSPGRLIALVLVGLGFLSIGIAFLLIRQEGTYASAQDFSAIPTEVNLPAPELNLTNLNGESVALKDYIGKVVLVNLWATWCPPCREEMPALQSFYDKYRSAGFELIAIDQGETEGEVIAFADEFNLTFPIWLDSISQAGASFRTLNLPSSYVIDRNGRIRLMWIGGISKRNLEKFVPDIIKE